METLREELTKLSPGDPEEMREDFLGTAGFWRVRGTKHYTEGTLDQVCQIMRNDYEVHKKHGETRAHIRREHADLFPKKPGRSEWEKLVIQIGRGYHHIGRLTENLYVLVIHQIYLGGTIGDIVGTGYVRSGEDSVEARSPLATETKGTADGRQAEPWRKYVEYISMPDDAPDSERRENMRFQFLFASSAEADRIISSLPESLRRALPAPHHECFAPPGSGPDAEGKYAVWYEGVALTLGEGKDLMNRVVQAGGGIYEAFLT